MRLLFKGGFYSRGAYNSENTVNVLKRSEIILMINKKRLKNAFFRNSFLKFKGRSLYFSKRGVLIIRLFLLKLGKLF